MNLRLISESALARESGASIALLRKLVRMRLVVVQARSPRVFYYKESAATLVRRVLDLQSAGYALRDIAVIVGRVEGHISKKPHPVIELSELLLREAQPSQVRELLEVGLIQTYAVVRGGESLVPLAAARRIKLLNALRECQFSKLAQELSDLAPATQQERLLLAQAQAEVTRSLKRMTQLKRLLQVARARAQFSRTTEE